MKFFFTHFDEIIGRDNFHRNRFDKRMNFDSQYFFLLLAFSLFYFYFQNTTTADLLDSQFRESVHVPGFVLA